MRERFPTIAIVLLCSLFLPWNAFCLEQTLDQIEVQGNIRIDRPTILLQVSTKPGEKFDSKKVSADVKEIYRTGWFDQVEAVVDASSGKLVLVFRVREKPAIRNVYLEGNKEVEIDRLKEQLGLDTRRFLDTRKIAAGIAQARAYYETKGLYGTEISYSTTPVEENQVDLTFEVKEGEKKYLREIVFEGNTKIEASELEDVIKTSSYSWWTSWISGSGVVREDMMQNDVRELSRYYLTKGFVEVKVAEPEIEVIEEGLRVTFRIDEGDVFTLASISAEGDLIDQSVEKTLAGVDSKIGEIFDVEKIRKDAFEVSEKFTDQGYAFANVEPDTDISRDEKTVSLVFRINKGELITVNRINISGNQKTGDNVIRRTLRVHEREQYSSSKIKKSEELLKRLGYFDEVTLTPEPTQVPGEVDLSLSVREGQTGTFSVGAGVSSGDGFIANARISERNLFGSGNSLTLQADSGTTRENYVLSFDNPRVYDSRLSWGIDLLSVEREYDDFDRAQKGGSMTTGYPLLFLGEELADDIRASISYELVEVDISNIDEDAPEEIVEEEGKTVSSSFTPKLTRNTIDNPLNPTIGSNQRASIELAGAGGDEEFWLFILSNTIYYPMVETSVGPVVFSQRTKFGYGDTFNNDEFPLFRRFFPGGIDSVRGFDSRELGPKDEQGNEYGGSKELVANFEMIFPVIPSVGFRGLVFYDIGNAFDDEENMDFGDLREAAGWGFRWSSPLGPIRIEFGYPLDKEPGEDSVQTHFSFGAPL